MRTNQQTKASPNRAPAPPFDHEVKTEFQRRLRQVSARYRNTAPNEAIELAARSAGQSKGLFMMGILDEAEAEVKRLRWAKQLYVETTLDECNTPATKVLR